MRVSQTLLEDLLKLLDSLSPWGDVAGDITDGERRAASDGGGESSSPTVVGT